LAPDLLSAPAKLERIRDVPSFKKREPSWKDEVRERMKHRRQRVEELPLFRDEPAPATAPEAVAPEPEAAPPDPVVPEPSLEAAPLEHDPPAEIDRQPPFAGDADFGFGPISAPEAEPASAEPADVVDLPLRAQSVPAEPERFDSPPPLEFPDLDSPPAPLSEPGPVERPAFVGERLRAAAVDALTLGATALVVVYFAARAAHVTPRGLIPTWPYLVGFLVCFGLAYAAFFTGLTGQTLGKMLLGLRVVDTAGAPPGHWRAAIRAALGTLGSLALVGVAPMFVDPARRALHDRLLRTRVVRS
jgi:uncharacterized RDD family membrane protein YckC